MKTLPLLLLLFSTACGQPFYLSTQTNSSNIETKAVTTSTPIVLTNTTLTAPLTQTAVSKCASSQILLNNQCIDCNSFMNGCTECSQRNDTNRTIQCDVCDFNFYLLTVPKKPQSNLTVTLPDDSKISMCVSRCEDFAYNYVSNKATRKCDFCGDTCSVCSSKYGCLDSYQLDHGFRKSSINYNSSFPFSALQPTPVFQINERCNDTRCDKCQELNNNFQFMTTYPNCDSCYNYVNMFSLFPQKPLCSICNSSTVPNCKQCDVQNTTACLMCNDNYWIDCVQNKCFACHPSVTLSQGCARCQQNGCDECLQGWYMTKDPLTSFNICKKCELDTHNELYDLMPNRCIQCIGEGAADKCKVCKIGFLGSSAGNPQLCELKCGSNQFPQTVYTTLNNNENTIASQSCVNCPLQCKTCIGSAPTQCTSCPDGQYLSIMDNQRQSGSCLPLIQSTASFNIFVTNIIPSINTQDKLLSNSTIGSQTNPFWNLQDALIRAQELAAIYSGIVQITIYLFAGNHYIVDSRGSPLLYYEPISVKPNENQNFALTIKPLQCSVFTPTIGQCLQSASTENVTVFNKQRDRLRIMTGASLTLDHVTIDALDSVLQTRSLGSPRPGCLDEQRQCCSFNADTIVNLSASDSFSCSSSFTLMTSSLEFDCFANWPRSLFQMKSGDSRVTSPSQLTLTSSTIRNFFYSMNSLVSLTQASGKVSFDSSTFSRISTCGGLIKSEFANTGKPKIRDNIGSAYLTTMQIDKIMEIWTWQDKLNPSSTALYYGTSSTPTSCSSDCFQVDIKSSTFSDITFGTSRSSLLVSSANGMRDLGKIVALKNLAASVTITKSSFNSLIEPYSDGCIASLFPSAQDSVNNFRQLFNSDFSAYQLRSLISLKGHLGSFTFNGNTVKGSLTFKGVIDVDMPNSSSAFEMKDNFFDSNAALVDANVLSLQRKADALGTCGQVTISNNSFTKNYGCAETNGVAFIHCQRNESIITAGTGTWSTPDNLPMAPVASTSATLPGVTISDNIIEGNFAGTNRSIIEVTGFPAVVFSGNKIRNNENWLPNTFISTSLIYKLQSNKSLPVPISDVSNCEQRAKSIITVRGTNSLTISNELFENNFIIDDYNPRITSLSQASEALKSNGILIVDATGDFKMIGAYFHSNVGFRGSLTASTTIRSTIGFKSALVHWERTQFETFKFEAVTFEQNWGYAYADNSEAPMPILFALTASNFKDPAMNLKLASLSLQNNIFMSADWLIDLQLAGAFLTDMKVANNMAHSIFRFQFSQNNHYYWVQNSIFKSNYLDSGSVFKTVEKKGFLDIYAPPNSLAYFDSAGKPVVSAFFNFAFQGCQFIKNARNKNLGTTSFVFKTSCIEVQGGQKSWMTMSIAGSTFDSNTGSLTNEIYIDKSVATLKIGSDVAGNRTTWIIDDTTDVSPRLAKVLYRPPDSEIKIDVRDTDFSCKAKYDLSVVMGLQEVKVEHNVALFWIEQESTSVLLDPLSNKQSQMNPIFPGMLDPKTFTTQFQNNSYKNCHNFNEGTVFHVTNGGRVYDQGSVFNILSAIKGGVGFASGDGSYLHITSQLSPITIQQINAFYGGIFYAEQGATVVITDNVTLRRIEVSEGAVAYLQNRGRLVIRNKVTISDNKMNKRGLIVAVVGSQFWVQNCVITTNSVTEDSAVIYASANRPQTTGYSTASKTLASYFEQTSVLKQTITNVGRLITLIDSNLQITDVTFQQNDAIYDDSYGIVAIYSQLTITNCQFIGPSSSPFLQKLFYPKIKDVYGGFLSIQDRSVVTVSMTSFQVSRATLGGCVMITTNSDVTFDNCSFKQCAANFGGAIYAEGHRQLQIKSSTFNQNIAYEGYGQNVYSQHAKQLLLIANTTMASYHNSVFTSGLQLEILDVKIDGEKAAPIDGDEFKVNGAGFHIDDTLIVNFRKVTMKGLKASYGGAIFFDSGLNSIFALQSTSNPPKTASFSFTELTITECSAEFDGGAFYLMNPVNMEITKSSITGCKAGTHVSDSNLNGEGGAIYYGCTLIEDSRAGKLQCDLNLQSIDFRSNGARVGGAIRWTYLEPNMTASNQEKKELLEKLTPDQLITYGSLSFKDNYAVEYGPEIAAVTLRMIKFESEEQYLSYYNQTSKSRQLPILELMEANQLDAPEWFENDTFDDVQSGGFIPTRYYGLVDKYNQVVSTNQGKPIRLSITNKEQYTTAGGFKTDLIGVTEFYSQYGTFNMSGITLLTGPGTVIKAELSIGAIDVTIPSNEKYLRQQLSKQINSERDYTLEFTVIVRNCTVGEGLDSNGACFRCPAGTFLLVAPVNATACQSCPFEKAYCEGGSKIGPKPGYWRSSNVSDVFYKCYEKEACLGMLGESSEVNSEITSYAQSVGVCNTTAGYYGALCSGCLPGFKRDDFFKCKKCSDKYELIFTVTTLGVFFILLFLLTRYTINGAENEDMQSVFNKVMMNHLQMLIIFAGFDLDWPPQVSTIFSLAAPIKLVTQAVISFDCFMDTRDLADVDPYYFRYRLSDFPIIYIKLGLLAVLPIVIIIISYVLWSIILRIQRRTEEHYTKFIATIVFLLFIIHPSLTQSMIDVFNCQNYSDNSSGEKISRMMTDLQVACWQDPLHKQFALYCALPCLLIWGIGIPATIFVLMRKESGKLETLAAKQKFGFLFNGYKRNSYFWEIVIMYRKVLCIFIAIILKGKGIILQAMVMLIVLLFFLQANSGRRPFLNRALNDIENLSLMTQLITIFCGIFFISARDPSSTTFDKNKDFSLDPVTNYVFFAVIAGSNLVFVVLWLIKVQDVIKDNLMTFSPRLYTLLCLWGRKEGWKHEIYKRAKNKKKEAIIQNIENVTLFMNQMKDIYIKDIFYGDHKRFLKLLYYIESERVQIDLTEKKHNFYIQGKMARERKFDRHRMEEVNKEQELSVDNNFIREMQKMRPKTKKITEALPSNPFLSTLIKLKRMDMETRAEEQRKKEEEIKKLLMEQDAAQLDRRKTRKLMSREFSDHHTPLTSSPGLPTSHARRVGFAQSRLKSSFKSSPLTDEENGLGKFYPAQRQATIISEYDEEQEFSDVTDLYDEKDDSQSRIGVSNKKTRRENQPDLMGDIEKSRNLKSGIHKVKKTKKNLNDYSIVDDVLKFNPRLPDSFQGFKDYSKFEGDEDDSSASSVESRLFHMRQLTERMKDDHSVAASSSKKKRKSKKSPVRMAAESPMKEGHEIGSEMQQAELSVAVKSEVASDEDATSKQKEPDKTFTIMPQQVLDEEDEELQGTGKHKRMRPFTVPRRNLISFVKPDGEIQMTMYVDTKVLESSGSFESIQSIEQPQEKKKVDEVNAKVVADYYKKSTAQCYDGPKSYPARVKKDKPSHQLPIKLFDSNGKLIMQKMKYEEAEPLSPEPRLDKHSLDASSLHTDESMKDFLNVPEPTEFKYLNIRKTGTNQLLRNQPMIKPDSKDLSSSEVESKEINQDQVDFGLEEQDADEAEEQDDEQEEPEEGQDAEEAEEDEEDEEDEQVQYGDLGAGETQFIAAESPKSLPRLNFQQ